MSTRRRRLAQANGHARGLEVAGLFAGVGGLELGLHRAGHDAVLLCENDPAAVAVLTTRFPGVRVHGDIRTLRSLTRGIALLAAGFPCQDLSQAGGVRGIAGARSSLVREVFRLLEVRAVPWVLLENVPFMLQLQGGRAIARITSQLSALGYRWAYRVVDALAFGVPQRRRRVFLLASCVADPADVLLVDESPVVQRSRWNASRTVGFYWTEGNRGVGWAVDAIPTLKGGSGLGIPSPPAVLLRGTTLIKPDIRDSERLQGFPVDWTLPAEDVASPSTRWRLVGNAVCVPVAEWIGRRLLKPGVFDYQREIGPVRAGLWPAAACDRGKGPVAVEIGEWPVRRRGHSLRDFLRFQGDPLSERATAGFVARAERAQREGKLRFEPGFLDALRAHLRRMRKTHSAQPVTARLARLVAAS
jgi:DNA (cytosine-5)-methyltransferase 1